MTYVSNNKSDLINLLTSGGKIQEDTRRDNKQKAFIQNIFMFYMLIINLVSLFLLHIYSSFFNNKDIYNFNSTQTGAIYAYNGVCLILTIVFTIYIHSRRKSASNKVFAKMEITNFIMQFYFVNKISLDFMTLICLTPDEDIFTYSKEIKVLFVFFMCLNSAIFFSTCKSSIFINKTYHLAIFIIGLMVFSLVFCYMLSYSSTTTSHSLNECIFGEISKVVYYFFLLILNNWKNSNYEAFNKEQSRIKLLEEYILFLNNFFNTSKSSGVIIIKDFTRIFSTSNYFDGLINELMIKRENSKLSFIRSNFKRNSNNVNAGSGYNYNNNNNFNNIVPSNKYSTLDLYERLGGVFDLNNNPIIALPRSNTNSIIQKKNDFFNFYKSESQSTRSIKFPMNKPLSQKNVLINIGDFKTMKTPIRKNFSTQSVNKMILPDIQEEKDEMEASYGMLRGTNSKPSLTRLHKGNKRNSKFNSTKTYLHNLSREKQREKEIFITRENLFNSDKRVVKQTDKGSQSPFKDNDVEMKKKRTFRSNPIVTNESIKKPLIMGAFAREDRINTEIKALQEDYLHHSSNYDSSCFNSEVEVNDLGTDFINLSREIQAAQNEILKKNEDDGRIVSTENENIRLITTSGKEIKSNDITDFNNLINNRRISIINKRSRQTIDDSSNTESEEESKFNPKQKSLKNKIIVNNNISINVINQNPSNEISHNNYEIKIIPNESISNNISNSNPINNYNSFVGIKSFKSENAFLSVAGIGNGAINSVINNVSCINGIVGNGIMNLNNDMNQVQIPSEGIKKFDLFSKHALLNINITTNTMSSHNLLLMIYCVNNIQSLNLIDCPENLKNNIIALNKSTINGAFFSCFLKRLVEIIQEERNYVTEELELGPYSLIIAENTNTNTNFNIPNREEVFSELTSKNIILLTIKQFCIKPGESLFYFIIKEKENNPQALGNSNENLVGLGNNYNNNLYNNNNVLNSVIVNRPKLTSPINNFNHNSQGNNNIKHVKKNSNMYSYNMENESFPGTLTSPQLNKSLSNSNKPFSKTGNNNNDKCGDKCVANSFPAYNAKVSALLHDFKHTIIENNYFLEYFIKKYKISLEEDDSMFFQVMDEYVSFLIKNITEFMKDPDNFFSGKFEQNNQSVDLVFLIDIMVRVFNRRLDWENETMKKSNCKAKDVRIYQNIIDKDNPMYKRISSNKNMLMCLFYNILSNSFKFTEKGEIAIEAKVLNSREIMVKIIDTGPGLSEKVLNNWSKPFNLECNPQNVGGSGLGQFIMGTIAKNLRLKMPLPERNPQGEGTVIKIIIPVSMQSLGISNMDHLSYLNRSDSFNTKKLTIECPVTFSIKEHDKENVTYMEDSSNRGNINIVSYNNNFSNNLCNNNNISNTFNNNLSNNISNTFNNNFNNNIISNAFNNNFNNNNNHVFRILCFDDDRIVINSIVEKLKTRLSIIFPSCKFEIEVVFTFDSFFENLSTNIILHKSHYDFFILDQNVSLYYKGNEIAELVKGIYKAYFGYHFEKLFVNFIFVTEQSDELKIIFEKKNLSEKKYFREDQVFGKREHALISNKIAEVIRKEFNFL